MRKWIDDVLKMVEDVIDIGSDDPVYDHLEQVAKLAMQLFDRTQKVHRLGKKAKRLLLYSALLHDIGYVCDPAQHHKGSMRMILDLNLAGISKRERKQIACIARYHKGAFPNPKHKVYSTLKKSEQKKVTVLASILRIADGLDYTHCRAVRKVKAKIDRQTKTLLLLVKPRKNCSVDTEIWRAKAKSSLFEQVFNLTVQIQPKVKMAEREA